MGTYDSLVGFSTRFQANTRIPRLMGLHFICSANLWLKSCKKLVSEQKNPVSWRRNHSPKRGSLHLSRRSQRFVLDVRLCMRRMAHEATINVDQRFEWQRWMTRTRALDQHLKDIFTTGIEHPMEDVSEAKVSVRLGKKEWLLVHPP